MRRTVAKDASTPTKKAGRTKPERPEYDDRWVANLIRDAKAEEAERPMTIEEVLAKSKRLSQAAMERAKKLGIKTDLRSAVRLIHEYRGARGSS